MLQRVSAAMAAAMVGVTVGMTVGMTGSVQAAPLSPRTDDFEINWQRTYGWRSMTRVGEFKNTLVDVFGRTVANENGSTTTPRIQATGRAENSKLSFDPGVRIDTYAHLEPRVRDATFPEPAGPDGPVRVWAETRFLDQKVFADSMRLVNVTSTRDVTRQDTKLLLAGPPPVYGLQDPVTIRPRLENQHNTSAYSHWADTWTFDKATVVTLKFKVHALTGVHLSADPGWTGLADHMYGPNGDNFIVLNNTQMQDTGFDASDRRDATAGRNLGASVQVFDTTHLRDQTEYCDEFGDCYPPMDPRWCPPDLEMYNCGRPVAGTGFTRLRFSEGEQAFWDSGADAEIESLLFLTFTAEPGAEYLAVSSFFALAANGGWVDGSSTMSLLDINLSNDAALTSTLATRFGVNLPITRGSLIPPGTVPEPTTLALLAASFGLMLTRRRGPRA